MPLSKHENVFYRLTQDDKKLPLTSSSSDLQSTVMGVSPSITSYRDVSPGMDSTFSDSSATEMNNSIVHRWTHNQSIICLACSSKYGLLFCGTQDSYILIFDLYTFQKLGQIKAHTGSVLCLHLAKCQTIMFSGSSDSLVKIWNIKIVQSGRAQRQVILELTHTIYSPVDIGDIFSIAWIDSSKTILFGSQNASISFAHLGKTKHEDKANLSSLPSVRYDRFFDSMSSGSNVSGSTTPIPESSSEEGDDGCQILMASKLIEIPSTNIISYAHNGYVYAMDTICDIDSQKSLLGGTIAEEFNDIILSGGGDGMVKIWGFKENKITLLRSLNNMEPVLSMLTKEEEDCCSLYCGLANGVVNLWDLSTFQLVRSFETVKGDVNCLSLSDTFLFVGTQEGICKKPAVNDNCVRWLPTNTACLALCQFKPGDVSYLISASMDNTVTLWNVNMITKSCTLAKSDKSDVSTTEMIEVLKKMVSFPTVSKQPEKYMEQSRKCASFIRLLLKKLGAVSSVLLPVPNANPVILATFKANSSKPSNSNKVPRILWYGHYDVIEADHIESWDSNPWEITPTNGYLYGRGVSDNKGPLLSAIYAVADLYKSKNLQCDAIFLIEGEEEAGSYGFQDIVTANKATIGDIDWVMLSNSYWLDDNVPCLNYGLRGVVAANVEVWSDKPDRHSGVDGGVSREPTIDLVNVLSKLTDDSGKVRIPEFYSTVKELGEEERSLYQQIIQKVQGAEVHELLTKWRMPSLTLHKVHVSGPGNSTVIPHAATATLSVRIVPTQDIEEVKKSLVSFILQSFKNLHTENHIKIEITHEAEPWLADTKNAAYKILYKNLQKIWGIEPIFIREGGSIPSIRFLEKTFDCEAAHLPTGQSSDNAHLSNERLRITNMLKAKEILEETLNELPCKGSNI